MSDLPSGWKWTDGVTKCEKDGAPMVRVPAGGFFMGRDTGDVFAKEHEKPGRIVFLDAFLIDVYPVTNRQFRLFIDEGGYDNEEFWSGEGWAWKEITGERTPAMFEFEGFNSPAQPASGVSWFEAEAYCRWAGKSLPTEAQWERAARGTDARLFPWGDEFPTTGRANFKNTPGGTTPVKAYPKGKSPCGCFDMSGNVNNWCLDWYKGSFYRFCVREGLDRNPVLDDELKKKIGGSLRLKVDKGGGFATAETHFEVLSTTDKVAWPRETRNPWNGFRCVIPLAQENPAAS